MEEIISQIQTAIFHLATQTGNNFRRKHFNILHKPSKKNISRKERKALLSLRKHDKISILSADKGNGTVIMDKEEYANKINAMLNNSYTYKKIKKDPTTGMGKKTIKLIKEANFPP
ncbi:uncharacterized protein LOC112495375 [Cephus cinctus]|uniref:Uncharacterized protein LOC112495375 n=1 Tax=Cephus cinctus TaxID=211228 RepID=A0AAJ7RVI1_CEPCN|nr:uncharacterized protein LOC112495375 [Cephus cinctus]